METRYIIQNKHTPEQHAASEAEWMKLLEEHPDVEFLADGIVCGCPHGDHGGIIILLDEETARTVLRYESVGETTFRTWVKVPVRTVARA